MARVKRGVTSHAKHKKVLKAAKGYYGRRKNTIRIAKQAVEKANQYAFRDRKRRKRTFRALWIQRLNAAVRDLRPDLQPIYRRPRPRPGSRSTARCCPISRSASRRRSRRSSRRPRPRWRPNPSTGHGRPRAGHPRLARQQQGVDARDKPGHDGALGAVPCPTSQQLEQKILAEVNGAADEAALEAVRVAALGKSGSVSALLKTLGTMTPDERKQQGAADQRPQGPRHGGAGGAPRGAQGRRRSTRGSTPRRSTSRCRSARARPRSAASIRSAR